MIEEIRAGRDTEAAHFSERLSELVDDVFDAAAALPHGNAFTNANKAIDQFMAHGPGGRSAAPPRLHAGVDLPSEFIALTGDALEKHELMPTAGYLG